MKKDRNCSMPYPIYNQGMNMPMMTPPMMQQPYMGMPTGGIPVGGMPQMGNTGVTQAYNNTEQQLNNMEQRINNLEERVNKLELAKGTTYSNKYSDSNYYML